MATSVSRAVSGRMAKLTSEFGRASRTAVERGAFEAKKVIGQEIRQATGDGRMSGVGAKGARVGVRYDIKGTENPTALGRATGPLHLVENPVKPHEITPKRRRRGAGKKAVVTPYGPKAKVQHPGTKTGKKPWAKGKQKAEPRIKHEVTNVFSKAFARGATK